MSVDQKAFEGKAEKIKKNVLCDLEEYYGDPDEWEESSADLVKYGIFYNNACNQLLKAALLYGYEVESFIKENLSLETKVELNKDEFQRHHYTLLAQYTVDRIVVALLSSGDIERDKAQEASDYHYKSLKEYGYENEVDAIKELDTESMLSTFVPQIIVSKLLNTDYSDAIKNIDPELKSREKIWMHAWQLLYRLYTSEKSGLEACWSDLVKEWKNCFIKSDFHAFNNSYLVLLYYLYCQGVGQGFDIRRLSEEILKA